MTIAKSKPGQTNYALGNHDPGYVIGQDTRVALHPSETVVGTATVRELAQISRIKSGSVQANSYISPLMEWQMTATNERFIFWTPWFTSAFGKMKQQTGIATTGYITIEDLTRIKVVQATPPNTYEIGLTATIQDKSAISEVGTGIDGTPDELKPILSLIVRALIVSRGDQVSDEDRHQADMFLNGCWDYKPRAGETNGLGLHSHIIWLVDPDFE